MYVSGKLHGEVRSWLGLSNIGVVIAPVTGTEGPLNQTEQISSPMCSQNPRRWVDTGTAGGPWEGS